MGLERALVMVQRHREHAPQTAGHDRIQVAAEGANGLADHWRDLRRGRAMTTPCVGAVAMVGGKAGPREMLPARFTLLGEEVRPQAIDQRTECGVIFAVGCRGTARRAPPYVLHQQPDVLGEHRELRMAHRTIVEERLETV